MWKAFIAACLMLGIGLAQAGDLTCEGYDRGFFRSFKSGKRYRVQLPCKFQMTDMECNGYRIHVTPGLDYEKSKYVYDTTFTIISKGAQEVWIRTDRRKLERKLNNMANDSIEVWSVKRGDATGPVFEVTTKVDEDNLAGILSVKGQKFEIRFQLDKDANGKGGVYVTCPKDKASFPSAESNFPASFCGNESGAIGTLKEMKQPLELTFNNKLMVFQVLKNANGAQNNQLCKYVMKVFNNKCANDLDRATAVKMCYGLISRSNTMSCLRNKVDPVASRMWPMNTFVKCVKSVCFARDELPTAKQECETVKERMRGCGGNNALPNCNFLDKLIQGEPDPKP